MKRYLSSTSFEPYTIPYGDYRTFDIDEACELISDKPISVTQVVNGKDDSGLKFKCLNLFMLLKINNCFFSNYVLQVKKK